MVRSSLQLTVRSFAPLRDAQDDNNANPTYTLRTRLGYSDPHAMALLVRRGDDASVARHDGYAKSATQGGVKPPHSMKKRCID